MIIGADEAGRGPVLGPLVICAACFDEFNMDKLRSSGVQDSKKLTSNQRESMVKIIDSFLVDKEIVVFPAKHIDNSITSGTNLNQLEVDGFIHAINSILDRGNVPDVIWLDAADIDEKRFQRRIEAGLEVNVKIIAKHKCDETETCVGAASILAKIRRDEIIKQLSSKYGNIGSGYPSDVKTRQFIKDFYKEHGFFPPFVRKTWKTMRNLEKELDILPPGQTRLF